MRKGTVIIGAGYSSEGKGALVDYITGQQAYRAMVVRFNGGANASARVVMPTMEAPQHIHSVYGAGAISGFPTYLSADTIVNPIAWYSERAQLRKLGVEPRLFINRGARLTLPVDIMMGQAFEIARKDRRHGSTGVGINETIQRCSDWRYRTHAHQLLKPTKLDAIARLVDAQYVPKRFHDNNFSAIPEGVRERLSKPEIMQLYLEAVSEMANDVTLVGDGVLTVQDHIIFQGQGGLLLDMLASGFPHLTPSRTGASAAVNLCVFSDVDEVEVIYVTRPYVTRHGAGPLPYEDDDSPYGEDVIGNEWQGRMRYAPLHVPNLVDAMKKDMALVAKLPQPHKLTMSIAMTHVDQVPGEFEWRAGSKAVQGDWQTLLWQIKESLEGLPLTKIYVGRGPTRKDIVQLEAKGV